VRINESDPEEEAPLVFIDRGRSSNLVRFRNDVPDELVEELDYLAQTLSPWKGDQPDLADYEGIRGRIHQWRSISKEEQNVAYRFPSMDFELPVLQCTLITSENAELLTESFPYTKSILDERSPVVAVVSDGQAVSACYSARKTQDAAEAGVATLEGYRGRGFAVATVAAWAHAVLESGLTPLYSTSWDNHASRAVAAKLGLEVYAATWAIS
jgi:RimJ/RimL family protein N-acetyltransferase